MMSDRELAQYKAARLLKKQGSLSSLASSEANRQHGGHKVGTSRSMSTVSYLDEPGHDENYRIPVKFENTFQLAPNKRFPYSKVQHIIKDVLEAYLAEEKYEPELCRQMSKTLSEVIKARVKELMIPRYKIICLVHIGQLSGQDMRVSSRCLWDSGSDTFSTSEFRNRHLYAIASVYGVYYE